MVTEEYRMGRDELLALGKQVSSLRKQLRIQAAAKVPRAGATLFRFINSQDEQQDVNEDEWVVLPMCS